MVCAKKDSFFVYYLQIQEKKSIFAFSINKNLKHLNYNNKGENIQLDIFLIILNFHKFT